MKKILSFALAVVFFMSLGFAFSTPAYAGWVNGYYRSNGTYVSGYYRSLPSYSSYKSYTPSYSSSYPSLSTRSYPSYSSGLKWQSGYYKPSTGTYVQGYFKTYSDRYTWNNRKSLYGW